MKGASYRLWLLLLLPGLVLAQSADLEREARLRAEIVDAILDGEPIDLETPDGLRFLGIYTETDAEKARGAVLVLHGRGFHPNWGEVVRPLRVGLIESGWNTLSIQLPVLEKTAKYFDYATIFNAANPRIEAAIADLRARGNERVVIVGHSCGFHMLNHWILERGDVATGMFDAMIGIGMGATDYRQPMVDPYVLDRIPSPVLDLFGGDDFPAVLRMAPERRELLQAAGNPLSTQIVVEGADHYFTDYEDALVDAVAGWLDRL